MNMNSVRTVSRAQGGWMRRLTPFAFLMTAAVGIGAGSAAAEDRKPAFRIGVVDSRAVALAYGRSDEFARTAREMRVDLEKARAANDEKRVKEIEQEGPWSQIRIHQQVFSTAPVTGILAKVKDKLPAIAEQAGVAVIVSKWEVQFMDSTVQTVDVTLPIARLFNPSEQVLEWVEQMKSRAPIAFEKLPLDPMM